MSTLDLLLRDGESLDRLLLDPNTTGDVTRRLLSVSLLGLVTHGLVLGISAVSLEQESAAVILGMIVALSGAFVGALAICLPSFYFYTLLSGLDVSFRAVTAQALRVQATTSVYLLGVLPFYAALAFAGALGVCARDAVLGGGLLMPFLTGLFGVHALYHSFRRLEPLIPRTHRRAGGYLGRLVWCWAAVYLAVAPIALWRLGEAFGLDVPHYVARFLF